MSLFAYVRPVDDNNHAPHVRRGLLSLANCVWSIREHAQVGDWLVGLTSINRFKDGSRRISYVARVDEKITRHQYWNRFAHYGFGRGRLDNYYEPETCHPFFQMRPNPIRPYWSESSDKDMKSQWILLSRTFRDFSLSPVKIPVLVKDLTLNPFWNRIDLSLQPPRQRHYRKFPYRVVDLEKLKLDWRFK